MKPKGKKPGNILLKVSRPCKEDWEQMHPTEQNRFCSHCEKIVIDFTTLTDQQITTLIASNPGRQFCGRFKKDQLNRQIGFASPQPPAYDVPEQPAVGTLLFTLKMPLPVLPEKTEKVASNIPLPHFSFFHHFLTLLKRKPLYR